jgi:Rrf2 family protein
VRLTKEEDYAILLMRALALEYHRRLSLQEVSNEFDIPYHFLKKIARSLKEAELVSAKEGAAGGYALSFPPHEINMAEIIEAIRGPQALAGCLDSLSSCPPIMKKVGQEVRDIFSKVTLRDMITGSDYRN